MGTMNPVARWREAHSDAVGTERDVTRMMRRETERPLHEVEGKEGLRYGVSGVVLTAIAAELGRYR